MTNKQKIFLRSLLKTIEQAKASQESIIEAMAIGVKDEAYCKEYVQSLQQYIHDAKRMVMICTAAYGDGSNIIAAKAIVNPLSDN